MDLYPLSFREFLDGVGQKRLREIIDEGDPDLLASFSGPLIRQLRDYLFVGGMPQAVQVFSDAGGYADVRDVQRAILRGYRKDMSKHAPARELQRVFSVWDSIPAHLSQENKRLVFGHLKKGARGAEYESAINWLVQAGIAVKVPKVSKPGIPLQSYKDDSVFKLFILDVGLLGAMADLPLETILEGDALFQGFMGALTEQYVCQELLAE